MDRLFALEATISTVRGGDLGMMKRPSLPVLFARAEALLLMDARPSDALESLLDNALNNVTEAQRGHPARFDAWVRHQTVGRVN